jgi:hypothetical protein
MTPRQHRLLNAIVRYREEHGFAPSYRELLPLVGLSANSLGGLTAAEVAWCHANAERVRGLM